MIGVSLAKVAGVIHVESVAWFLWRSQYCRYAPLLAWIDHLGWRLQVCQRKGFEPLTLISASQYLPCMIVLLSSVRTSRQAQDRGRMGLGLLRYRL